MKLMSLAKYSVRFLFLQILLTYTSIFYFNRYLISTKYCEPCAGNSFRMQINNNLWEDRNRFFSFVPERYTEVEYFVAFFILFLTFSPFLSAFSLVAYMFSNPFPLHGKRDLSQWGLLQPIDNRHAFRHTW